MCLVSIGDTTQFSCNFTGEHRVRREKVTWLKGIHYIIFFSKFILNSIDLSSNRW